MRWIVCKPDDGGGRVSLTSQITCRLELRHNIVEPITRPERAGPRCHEWTLPQRQPVVGLRDRARPRQQAPNRLAQWGKRLAPTEQPQDMRGRFLVDTVSLQQLLALR